MTNRYFCEYKIEPPNASLTGPEATHFTKVMRGEVGDSIVIFDGQGAEHDAVVTHVDRHGVTLTVTASRDVDRELPVNLVLGVPLPKGDRQRWLVEKAVELGVTRLIPLLTRRGVAQPKREALTKFRRWVVEASKQSGRNRLMEIEEPHEWSAFLEAVPDAATRLLADPGGDGRMRESIVLAAPIYFAVGPEGGFTEEEVSLACENAWHLISLGPRILRVETAALALAAIVGQVLERERI